ncbi:MAG: GNAT family N-acetyltransferase [Lachnospiraceae bacterium]|nr:GNAT family N-acetyltransferase [Lachnospiraceae bacterium]
MQITRITRENEAGFRALFPRSFYNASSDTIRLGAISDTGEAAGVIGARFDNDSTDIIHIYVLPKFRGQGAGRALVSAVEEAAGNAGQSSISVEFFDEEAVTGFYSALGYDLFGGRLLYRVSVGEVMRSPLFKRYIKEKPYDRVKKISSLNSREKRIVDSHLSFSDYDPDWSTVVIRGTDYQSILLAEHFDKAVSLIWLNSHSDDPTMLLHHLRSLMASIWAEYPDDRDITIRMTFEREFIVQKICNLLGGSSHMHPDGRCINAVKVWSSRTSSQGLS